MEMQSNYNRGTSAFRAVWEGQNGDKLRSVFDECFEFYNLDGKNDVTDLKGFRQRVAGLRAAHPGARLQVQNPFGAGSHIAFDWSLGDASPRRLLHAPAEREPGRETMGGERRAGIGARQPVPKGSGPGATDTDRKAEVRDSQPPLDAFIGAMEALYAGDHGAALDCGLQRARAHGALAACFRPEFGGDVEQALMAALLVHRAIFR